MNIFAAAERRYNLSGHHTSAPVIIAFIASKGGVGKTMRTICLASALAHAGHSAVGVLRRATAWFAERGIVVERALSDNGSCYRAHAWRDACADLGIRPKRTRPYRPQINGKLERFHRALCDGWAYAQFSSSTAQRNAALPGWLHFYNHHRPHSATGGQSPD